MSDLPKTLKTRKEIFLNAIATGQRGDLPTPVTREEAYLKYIAENGSGGGGTSDYGELSNKPQINGVTLIGNKTTEDLHIESLEMTPITYSELVTLRANSGLVAGKYYRITDYVTTTAQAETQSARNVFDVIVRADSNSVLNENAYAAQHEGDTYFEGQHLGAWELKYSLDNDTDRFAWADSTNGKGVIYFMRDEYGNECGYDFKNIQMKFYRIISVQNISSDFVNTYSGSKQVDGNNLVPSGCNISTTYTEWRYTFDLVMSSTHYDYSLNKWYLSTGNNHKLCYNNRINALYGDYNNSNTNRGKQYINIISFRNTSNSAVVVNSYCYGNEFEDRNFNYSFGNNCYANSFGDGCCVNSFTYTCYNNSFGKYCTYNSFGSNCYGNSFGSSCGYNSFGSNCDFNSFTSGCNSNSFRGDCHNNSFSSGCRDNSFMLYCNYNSLGAYCQNNSFTLNCKYNSFKNDCRINVLAEGCCYNSFGNSCTENTLGNVCLYNVLENKAHKNVLAQACSSNSLGANCSSNSLGANCSSNNFGNSCNNNSLGDKCYNYTNIDFSSKTVSLGFDGRLDGGFINSGNVDPDNEEVYVEGTIYNNFNVAKTVNITIDFTINYNGSDDVEQTVTQPFTVPANDSLNFKVATSYIVNDFSDFKASGTATFTVGSATITSEGYYEY